MKKPKSKGNGNSENESYSLEELPLVLAEKTKEIKDLQKQLEEKDGKLAEIKINYDALGFQFNQKDRYFRDVLNHKKQCTTLNTKIEIDPEMQSLIPPLTAEELELLEGSIQREGVRDPIIIWAVDDKTNILLDGHNRYKICVEYGIQCAVEIKHFQSRNHASNWIINNQLGRRNLTTEQKNYLIGKRYESEKKEHGGDRKSRCHNDHLKTYEKIAAQTKVSPRTVVRSEKFAIAVDKISSVVGNNIKKQILGGEIKIAQKDIVALAQKSNDEIRETIETGQIRKERTQRTAVQAVQQSEIKQFISALKTIENIKENTKELIGNEDIETDDLLTLKTLIENNLSDISEILELATEVVQSSLFEELL